MFIEVSDVSTGPSDEGPAGLILTPVNSLYLPGRDVPDPVSQDEDTFNDCAVLIEAGTALHIARRRL